MGRLLEAVLETSCVRPERDFLEGEELVQTRPVVVGAVELCGGLMGRRHLVHNNRAGFQHHGPPAKWTSGASSQFPPNRTRHLLSSPCVVKRETRSTCPLPERGGDGSQGQVGVGEVGMARSRDQT